MDNEQYPHLTNKIVRELEARLIAEVQKQVPIRIVHSMLVFQLENGKVLLANMGEVKYDPI